MRKIFIRFSHKRLLVVMMTVLLVVSAMAPIFAQAAWHEQDGIKVSIDTDKESYSIGETIVITVTVENNNSAEVENITVDLELPEGIQLAEGASSRITFETLAAGAVRTQDVEAEAVKDVDIGNGDGIGSTGNDAVIDENVTTGNINIGIYLAIAAGLAVGGFLYIKRRNSKAVKTLSLLFLVAVGTIAPIQISYAADSISGRFEVSKTVKVDGEDKEIVAIVNYRVKGADIEVTAEYDRVSVHNPSIVKNPATDTYYVSETDSEEDGNNTDTPEEPKESKKSKKKVPTVTAEVSGTAYPDVASDITITFTGDKELGSKYPVKINGTTVTTNSTVDMLTVKSVTYSGNTCTVTATVKAISGWHSINGKYEVSLMNGTTALAKETVSYALTMSPDTEYTQIKTTAANAYTSGYFKAVGTKLYAMAIIKSDKIHCDSVTAGGITYGWSDGINAELKVTIDGTEYSLGSFVSQGKFANPITGNSDNTLIKDGSSAERSYMALGTFDDDDDTDEGCILLNVVDLTDIGLTEDTMKGKQVIFSGFFGPNDGGERFVGVDSSPTYTLAAGDTGSGEDEDNTDTPEEPEEPEKPEEEAPTVTVAVSGTAYPDEDSDVTITFTGDKELSDKYPIKINGTTVTNGTTVDMLAVKSITYSGNTCKVTATVKAISGKDSINGKYEISLMNDSTALAKETVSYALEMSPDTAYTQIKTTAANEYTSGYFKAVGTKLYAMTIIKSDKIHCDGVTAGGITYGWWDGISAELEVTIDGTDYSLGSYVSQGKFANPITGNSNSDNTLIKDGSSAERSFMALGTFDDDDDTDEGCILLNVVDLADIGLTENNIKGKQVTFSGFFGPNDFGTNGDGTRFIEVNASETYLLAEGTPEEPEEEAPTVTAEVSGTAYPDAASDITITFTGDKELSDKYPVKVNGTTVTNGTTVDMLTVKSVTYSGNTCTIEATVKAISGKDSVNGKYEVSLMNGTTALAKETVSYALTMSPETAYTQIQTVLANAYTSGYFKAVGTKLYAMTIIKSDKIHCAGVTAGTTEYEWWNGINAELKVTIDEEEYSLGSHVFQGKFANPITWNGNDMLIKDGSSAERSFMALGTFDDDDDTDEGCILLNVVDLTDIGLTEDTMKGKQVTFSGFFGPNDGVRLVVVDSSPTYTLAVGDTGSGDKEPEEPEEKSDYAYYQDYSKSDISEWTSGTTSGTSALGIANDGDERGNYFKFSTGNDSKNIGAYAEFDLDTAISGKYTITLETSFTAGVLTQRSQSGFAILGTDARGHTGNDLVSSGYILKLMNQPPEGTAANQSNYELQDTWYINDTEITVKIPVGEWVTIKAEVDTTAGTADITISQNGTELFSGEVTISGSGELYGLWILRGRGIGTASVDTIAVTVEETGSGDKEPEEEAPTVTAAVSGTAYPDVDSDVTITFTGDEELSDKYPVKVNGTTVINGTTVDMLTVKSIAYSGNTCTVEATVKAISGKDSVNGKYEVSLMNGSTTLAKETVSYALEMSPETAYTQIQTVAANAYTSGYFKAVGTKLYAMTIIKSDKIHCDDVTVGTTEYGWWNGINAELKVTIDGTKYSLGSYVYQGKLAEPITWNSDDTLIKDGSSAERSYMALGTFDDDDDMDEGCILLNVVDLTDIGLTEDTINGKQVTFSGFLGPNDGGVRFIGVDDSKTYTLAVEETGSGDKEPEEPQTGLKYTTIADYDFTGSKVPEGVTLDNGATATEEGAKLTDSWITLPSNLFAALDDDAEMLEVEITFSKQNSTWPDSQWSERIFNFTDDFDVEDGVQNGTNGLGLSYNGTFGTTKVPYQPGVYMDSALTGTYAIPLDTMVVVKAELDFTTNTATLWLDGVKVKSGVSTDKITVSDLKKFTYNTIGRSYDMWSMYGFMTVANFKVSYAKTV